MTFGAFQEVDGRRVFVHRAGDGGPAVVVLPGAGLVGLDYLPVQQQIPTAFLYDRGGTGYSDPVPLPRSAAAVATELHDVLRAQSVPGPYVLVAHSLSGLYAHRFAQLYPSSVAGLVWWDAVHRDWDDYLPVEAGLAAGSRMAAAPSDSSLRDAYAALLAAHPQEIRESLVEAHLSDDWLRAGFAERTNLVALADELRDGPEIPDVPLAVLTGPGIVPVQRAMAARTKVPEQLVRAIVAGKTRMAAALVGAVSDGKVLEGSDVVAAIRYVVSRA